MNKNEGFNRDLSWGTNYQGAVTLFGMLRDIDPTKIYTKYDGHNHYRKFEDYDKFFLERGFERILINVAFNEMIQDIEGLSNSDKFHRTTPTTLASYLSEDGDITKNSSQFVNMRDKSSLYDENYKVSDNILYDPAYTNDHEYNCESENFDGEEIKGGPFFKQDNVSLYYHNKFSHLERAELPSHVVVYLNRKNLSIYYVRTEKTNTNINAKGLIYGYLHYTPETKKQAVEICEFMLQGKPAKENQYNVKIVILNNGNLKSEKRSLPVSTSILNLPIKKNYNDDLNIKKLYEFVESDSGGLMVLHGEPGTGKTSLIKHLMQRYSNSDVAPKNQKSFIYLPANIAHQIDNPAWLPFFLENAGAIFIIEDAEQLVKSRSQGNSGLSAFLNATDGILSDMLSGKFIVTFNAKINQDSVDEALLRKGRLKYIYEFKKLTKEKSSQFLGKPVDKDYSLTDLFNWDEETNKQETNKKIGF